MNMHSVTFRLAVWCAGVSLLVCAGFGVYTYLWLRYFLTLSEATSLHHRARQIAAIIREHIDHEGEAFTADLITTSYAPEHNDRFIRVRRGDGTTLYASGQPSDQSFDVRSIAPLPVIPEREQEQRVVVQKDLLQVQASAKVGAENYVIDCGVSILPIRRVERLFLGTLAFGLPLMLIVAIAGGRLLVRRALEPVREIIHTAREITSFNLDRRLPVARTEDEIELLSVVLNQMIDRLDDALEHSRRFTADASHELRTPLTIMRVELESIGHHTDLDAATREKIGSVLEETERLGGTVESLFAITRLEAGEALMDVSRFDLTELVVSTAAQMSLLAEEKHIAVHSGGGEAVEVTGDRLQLKRVLVNLLDNAIKYSGEGGEITLSTRAVERYAVMEVKDRGPGIPPESLGHVFDRFFRADSVRTHSQNGAGLGLSIARSICSAHGGTVEASNRVGGGCCITVRLPLALPSLGQAGS